jgi:hypothetical protein
MIFASAPKAKAPSPFSTSGAAGFAFSGSRLPFIAVATA